MSGADRILSEFIDAWNAGRRPRARDYLSRAEPHEREALADEIATWLEIAPAPAYDEATRARIRAEPAVAGVLEAMDREAGLWPSLLPRLRRQARLSVAELAARLADAVGVRGAEAKTERYLRELEAGHLDAAGLSRRVLEALGRLLAVSPDELERAGRFGAAPAVAFYRAEERAARAIDALEAVADALSAPAPEHWDEVDELFRGARPGPPPAR